MTFTALRRTFAAVAVIAGGAGLTATAFPAMADEVTTYVTHGAAIGGTDPVAYFTDGKPVAGSDEFTATYDGVTWKFASAANRDAFVAEPEKYAPAYGGYCATGASFGVKIPIDPNKWHIVDGKLYLNANEGADKRFREDVEGTISRADEAWPKIKQIPADKL
ncbi:YHS domain-containing (seleno)protein [Breoghania sp. L-A4]|uniref:YHS domain-containing (seleno)protein n=1 Tax=Breoghania sp. L-A4 TaxID=2304600 RepID=UPI000E35D77B|nr:YHS domain-containing (seleno)protein [Breoghania sp. L-A4]AXS40286.1 YHS domain-containing protein [Breoghania sp. L-A4]